MLERTPMKKPANAVQTKAAVVNVTTLAAVVAVKKKKGNAVAMVAANTKSDFKRAPRALFLYIYVY